MSISNTAVTDYACDYDEELMLAEQEAFEYRTRNDGFWAALLLGLIIFGPTFVLPAPLPPFRVVDVLILLLWPMRVIKTGRFYGSFLFSAKIRLFSLFILAMTGVLIFSMAVNIMTGRNLFFFKDLFYPLIFIRMIIIASITASLNLRRRQLRQLAAGILLLAVLSIVLAYGQKSGRFGIALVERFFVTDPERVRKLWREAGRAVGTFGNSNVFAGSLVMLSAILLPLMINIRGILRYIILATLMAMGMALLLAVGSRTSIVSFVFIVLLTLTLSLRRGSRMPALIISVLVIVLFMLVRQFAYELPIPERLRDMIAPGEGRYLRDSLAARLSMWKHSLQVAGESIIVGVGATKIQLQLTDNGYFFTLLRLGIMGLGVYLLMLALLVKRGIRAVLTEMRPHYRGMMLGLLMVLFTHLVFEVTGEFFWNVRYGELFAAFMGLLCGLSYQIMTDYSYDQSAYEYGVSEEEPAEMYQVATYEG